MEGAVCTDAIGLDFKFIGSDRVTATGDGNGSGVELNVIVHTVVQDVVGSALTCYDGCLIGDGLADFDSVCVHVSLRRVLIDLLFNSGHTGRYGLFGNDLSFLVLYNDHAAGGGVVGDKQVVAIVFYVQRSTVNRDSAHVGQGLCIHIVSCQLSNGSSIGSGSGVLAPDHISTISSFLNYKVGLQCGLFHKVDPVTGDLVLVFVGFVAVSNVEHLVNGVYGIICGVSQHSALYLDGAALAVSGGCECGDCQCQDHGQCQDQSCDSFHIFHDCLPFVFEYMIIFSFYFVSLHQEESAASFLRFCLYSSSATASRISSVPPRIYTSVPIPPVSGSAVVWRLITRIL